MRRPYLAILSLLAFVTSSIHPLNAELLFQSLLRGDWLLNKGAFPHDEEISVLRTGSRWNPANSLSDILTVKLQHLVGDQGIFVVEIAILFLSAIVLLLLLRKIVEKPALAFILALLASIGMYAGISDLGTAIGVLLCTVELTFLFSGSLSLLLLLLPIHALFDGSYFVVALAAPLFGVFEQKTLQNLVPAILSQVLMPIFGLEMALGYSPFSVGATLISTFLALLLAGASAVNRVPHLMLAIVTILGFAAIQLATQFPSLSLLAPVLAACIWKHSSGGLRERWSTALSSLEERMSTFLSRKNRLGVYWLSGTFIFFQIATTVSRPVLTEVLPVDVLDTYIEERPTEIPFHSYSVGGYLGYRFSALFGTPSNFTDSSPLRLTDLKARERYKDIFLCKGNWREQLQTLDPRAVLCQGWEPLCQELRKDPKWTERYKTEMNKKLQLLLDQFPRERAELYKKRFEERAWHILTAIEPAG